MDNLWSTALVNGAVVLALAGALWRSNIHRLDRVQQGVEKKVDRAYCGLQHQTIHEDIGEIKDGQEKMTKSLEEIRVLLARENGRRRALEEKP